MGNTVGVSVLFTDLVGSTALAAALGPADAERLRVVHFGLLREAVEDHGGREVKNLGDGIMAVFPGASAALEAAVAMQRAVHRHNATAGAVPVAIRTGVATGDCTEDDGDFFGEPVVQAARLCARAEGGEVLAHAVFRMLVPRDAHEFVDVGDLELKGLPEPVPVVRVEWSPEDDVTAIPLQTRLTVHHAAPLVGREHERQVLHDGLKAAEQGERTVVLVTGEAGLGKTRLTSTFAAEAAASGAVVLYGRCDEDLAVPYLPWSESLDHYVEHADEGALADVDANTAGQLVRLLPSLERRFAGDLAGQGQTDQYALVAAVARLLGIIASRRTTVLVLDDLHWADAASLLLLRHVATTVVDARLLIVGTYRETDLGPDDALTEVSASLHRVEGVHRLPLEGLSDGEVVALVEAIAGHELDDDGVALAHALRGDAAGNPFFVVEVLRHLAEAGEIVQGEDGRWTVAAGRDTVALPQSVRDVVGQRVRRLGHETHELLTTAAVVGREFDAEVVAAACQLDEDDVLERLEASMAGGLIAEVPDCFGRFTFTHALVQHTLYGELSASRRARQHRAVAEAIEGIVGDQPGTRVGELANHWFAAVRPSELERAISYATKAGERALDASAPEEAVRWFTQALEAAGDDDPEIHAEMLLRLGEAERRAGRETYRGRLLEAAGVAERCGRTDVLVAAAIENFRGTYSNIGDVDGARVATLESALRQVDPADRASRARLMATLAGEMAWDNDPRRVELARGAMEMARAAGDDVVLDAIERIGSAANIPELLHERDQQTQEAIALTRSGADPMRRFFALDRRTSVLLELADMDRARTCSAERRAIAEQLGEPTLRWIATYGDALLDLLEGDVGVARQGNEDAFALGVETGQPDTMLWYAAFLMQANWHDGRFDEVLPLVEMAIEQAPAVYLTRPFRAMILHRAGRGDEARAAVAEMARERFPIPNDLVWLSTTAMAAEAVHLVGDRESAAVLAERLAPFPEHVAANRHLCFGAVSYQLGLLAATVGDAEEAERHLEDAVGRNGRLRSPLHQGRALVALADLRRSSGMAGADDALEQAVQLVDRFRIEGLRDQVRSLGG